MYESDQITFFVKFVSGNLHTQGVWEPQITALLQKALRQDTTSTLVDVGAHVGYYSLLAAAMGHKVISITLAKLSLTKIELNKYLENE